MRKVYLPFDGNLQNYTTEVIVRFPTLTLAAFVNVEASNIDIASKKVLPFQSWDVVTKDPAFIAIEGRVDIFREMGYIQSGQYYKIFYVPSTWVTNKGTTYPPVPLIPYVYNDPENPTII